ncbi:hypothetical protein PR048_025944 [Dryococelus australis]|uniref:Uncharacterized protein n=1 Tax=Dryococelus australis TaxID=614101 RepID=A0ABQ9GJY4_9NEOP|nr:hypothetical protein PR048_025944 [Dryococelus australis]
MPPEWKSRPGTMIGVVRGAGSKTQTGSTCLEDAWATCMFTRIYFFPLLTDPFSLYRQGKEHFASSSQDKTDVEHVYTEVDFVIGSQFTRHALDDSEPVADLQGNISGSLCHSRISRIVPDDAAGRRVFSGIFRFLHLFVPARLHTHIGSRALDVKSRPISALTHSIALPRLTRHFSDRHRINSRSDGSSGRRLANRRRSLCPRTIRRGPHPTGQPSTPAEPAVEWAATSLRLRKTSDEPYGSWHTVIKHAPCAELQNPNAVVRQVQSCQLPFASTLILKSRAAGVAYTQGVACANVRLGAASFLSSGRRTKKTWRWVCPTVINRLLESASGNIYKVGDFPFRRRLYIPWATTSQRAREYSATVARITTRDAVSHASFSDYCLGIAKAALAGTMLVYDRRP